MSEVLVFKLLSRHIHTHAHTHMHTHTNQVSSWITKVTDKNIMIE